MLCFSTWRLACWWIKTKVLQDWVSSCFAVAPHLVCCHLGWGCRSYHTKKLPLTETLGLSVWALSTLTGSNFPQFAKRNLSRPFLKMSEDECGTFYLCFPLKTRIPFLAELLPRSTCISDSPCPLEGFSSLIHLTLLFLNRKTIHLLFELDPKKRWGRTYLCLRQREPEKKTELCV